MECPNHLGREMEAVYSEDAEKCAACGQSLPRVIVGWHCPLDYSNYDARGTLLEPDPHVVVVRPPSNIAGRAASLHDNDAANELAHIAQVRSTETHPPLPSEPLPPEEMFPPPSPPSPSSLTHHEMSAVPPVVADDRPEDEYEPEYGTASAQELNEIVMPKPQPRPTPRAALQAETAAKAPKK